MDKRSWENRLRFLTTTKINLAFHSIVTESALKDNNEKVLYIF